MNIGIDLDDTITNTGKTFFEYGKKYNIENNIEFEINENEWDFDKSFGWTEENIEDFCDKYLDAIFKNVEIKPNAKDKIDLLKEEGHKIIIITARSKKNLSNMLEVCKNWLDKNDVRFDKIIIDGTDKAEKCKENNIDVFIDDRNLSLRKCL